MHRHLHTTRNNSLKHNYVINPLECRGNYSATPNNMKLVHWPLTGGLSHLVQ